MERQAGIRSLLMASVYYHLAAKAGIGTGEVNFGPKEVTSRILKVTSSTEEVTSRIVEVTSSTEEVTSRILKVTSSAEEVTSRS